MPLTYPLQQSGKQGVSPQLNYTLPLLPVRPLTPHPIYLRSAPSIDRNLTLVWCFRMFCAGVSMPVYLWEGWGSGVGEGRFGRGLEGGGRRITFVRHCTSPGWPGEVYWSWCLYFTILWPSSRTYESRVTRRTTGDRTVQPLSNVRLG